MPFNEQDLFRHSIDLQGSLSESEEKAKRRQSKGEELYQFWNPVVPLLRSPGES